MCYISSLDRWYSSCICLKGWGYRKCTYSCTFRWALLKITNKRVYFLACCGMCGAVKSLLGPTKCWEMWTLLCQDGKQLKDVWTVNCAYGYTSEDAIKENVSEGYSLTQRGKWLKDVRNRQLRLAATSKLLEAVWSSKLCLATTADGLLEAVWSSKLCLATTDGLLEAVWSSKLCLATTDGLLEAVWSSKLCLATTD